jgi:hypothetical protein
MSFAACGGKLYASIYDAIVVRTDGPNPSWQTIYKYPGSYTNPNASGFRGLTCVPKLNGSGSMLIAALEGPGDIYEFPLDGSQPTVELNMLNYLSTQKGAWVGYVIPAYNNMPVYPQSGTTSCPDLLIGLGLLSVGKNSPNNFQGYLPDAFLMVRHCNGSYDDPQTIVDPSISPKPTILSTRALAVSQFPGDPAGTIYAGGFDAHSLPAHNSAWLYRGRPTNRSSQVAAALR